MRRIVNFLLTMLVFWLGDKYFNEYVSVADVKTLIIVSIGMFLLGWLYTFCFLFTSATFVLSKEAGCLFFIILFLTAFIWTPVRLIILNNAVDGFRINGFLTYLILTFIFSTSLLKDKKNKSKD